MSVDQRLNPAIISAKSTKYANVTLNGSSPRVYLSRNWCKVDCFPVAFLERNLKDKFSGILREASKK